MKSCLLLFSLLVVLPKANGQVRTDSILIEGNYRTFHFQQPKGTTPKQNVIFVLHGSGGNGKGMMEAAANLEALAQKEQFLLVYPDGYKNYWNECRKEATSLANKEDINEQAFFEGMLAFFRKNYKLSGNQFFVIGLSGGGHMAYKLALTMPDKCRAISAIVANLPEPRNLDCSEAGKPVAVMITNGTNDTVNPHQGGEMAVNGNSFGFVRSTDSSLRYWAELAGYKGAPKVEELPDPDPSNNQSIVRHTYRGKNKPEVSLLEVKGGGHAFPQDLDVFLESWAFFKRELNRK